LIEARGSPSPSSSLPVLAGDSGSAESVAGPTGTVLGWSKGGGGSWNLVLAGGQLYSADPQRGRIAVNDSKKVHTPASGPKHLEMGVLCFAALSALSDGPEGLDGPGGPDGTHGATDPERFAAARHFRAYFLRCVTNAALDATRHHETITGDAATYERVISLLESREPDPSATLEQNERREAVRAALAQLTPVQRAVIVQRYYLGRSVQEMAAQENIPEGTVKSRINRGRRELARRLRAMGVTA